MRLIKRKKIKSSVSVVALVTTAILMILAITLTNMVFFSMITSEREVEIQRARWFLEGRVQEYFDQIIRGNANIEFGRRTFVEEIEEKEQPYDFNLYEKDGAFFLHASMRWKNRYATEQLIQFNRLNIFEYALFFNGDKEMVLMDNLMVVGDIGVKGRLRIINTPDNRFFLYASPPSFIPRIDFPEASPVVSPIYFTESMSRLLEMSYQSFDYERLEIPNTSVFNQSERINHLELPSFNTIWRSYYPYRDTAWFIDNPSFYTTKQIANPLSSTKELIAIGNGYSTSFRANRNEIQNVYIKRTDSRRRFQRVESLDYSYFYGPQSKDRFFRFDRGQLTLVASSMPIPLMLPEESIQIFREIGLTGRNWSVISRDERIEDLYFDNPAPRNRLLNNVDYRYYFNDKAISLQSRAFFENHTWSLGRGDGARVSYPIGKRGSRTYIYVGQERTIGFSSYGNTIVFTDPPPYGVEIRSIIDPPQVYARKSPPSSRDGIFIDTIDNAVVLDLSRIQNYPRNGVILSTLPVFVTGNAREPLVIISSDSIYLDNINQDYSGEPVMVISREGVWVYRKSDSLGDEMLNKVVIYSPLKGLYTITENGNWGNYPINVYGTVVLSYENPEGSVDIDLMEKNYIYYPGILNYINKKPFSIFPLPIDIVSVRRR